MSHQRHVILIAHGSRLAASNDEVVRFAERIGAALQASGAYDRVGYAFLELADPSIPQAIDQAVAGGAGQVDLFPYFLAAGRHVAEDIPAIVTDRQAVHPEVGFQVLDHLGAWRSLPDLVVAGLRDAPG